MLRAGLVVLSAGVLLATGVASGADSHARQPSTYFESPSGNIRCVIGRGSGKANVRCVTLRPRQAAQIVAGQKARERPFSAVGPLVSGFTLSYGTSEQYLGFLCRSKKAGVSCVDTRTKRGFRIAREGVVPFPRPKPAPAPAPRRPAPTTPAPSGPGYSTGYNCDDFPLADGTTAQDYLERYPGDPSGLDGNDDGVACEGS